VVQIRPATKDDFDDLLAIEDACFSTYYYGQYKFGVAEFLYYLRNHRSIFLAAAEDTHVVGYTAAVVRRTKAAPAAHIESIAVLPQHRQQGIGGQLLRAVMDEARQHRCDRAVLEVATPNEEGIAFFKKHGFYEVGKLPNYYGRGLDGILMCVDL
jgi:ribosomal-protein-alanine N-acetyltransferase